MNHAALFNGIGGFQLAAQWMGWNNVMSVEIDPFCNKVTKHHFPNCIQHGDIKTTDFSIYHGRIDIITGGFPCQPYSTAGKRLGNMDDRHLWPEMLRAIREIQPSWVVGENVRGLTNWNGGMVFDEVQSQLEAEGYEVLPFLLPACAINAPHKRERIWFIAYSNNIRCGIKNQSPEQQGRTEAGSAGKSIDRATANCSDSRSEAMHQQTISSVGLETPSNPNGKGLQIGVQSGFSRNEGRARTSERGQSSREYTAQDWSEFPTQSPVCGGDDGLPAELDGITFPKWRQCSIKGYGNAIVPGVALKLFKAIEQYINVAA